MATAYLADYGLVLISNAYNPIPVRPHGKAPAQEGWRDSVATPELYQLWVYTNGFGNYSVGITTGLCVFADIDTLDAAVAAFLSAAFIKKWGGLVRYGRRPKVGILVRTDEPFAKITSRTLVSPEGVECRIEILGEGQQFVAFGIHPDTGSEYEWVDGGSPDVVPHDELPVITQDEMRHFVSWSENQLLKRGWIVKPRATRNYDAGPIPNGHDHTASASATAGSTTGSTPPPPPDADDEAFADLDQTRVGLTDAELEALVMLLPNAPKGSGAPFDARDDWNYIGFAIHHETEGSEFGRQLFYRWSAQYDQNQPEWDKLWYSIKDQQARGRIVTARFLLKAAQPYRPAQLADFIARLLAATTTAEINQICEDSKLHDLGSDRDMRLAPALQAAFLRLTGQRPPIAQCRAMLRPKPHMPPGIDEWTLLTLDHAYYHRPTGQRIRVEPFNTVWRAKIPQGNASDLSAEHEWIKNAYGTMYLPHDPAVEYIDPRGVTWINSYVRTGIPTPVSERRWTTAQMQDVFFVRRHFYNLFADRDAEIILSFLAYLVQTNKRVNWMPVLQGAEAIGKSFVQTLMAAVLGSYNVQMVSTETLSGSNFSDYTEGTQLLVFNEIRQAQNKRNLIERLKSMIGSDFIEIHPKGRKPYTAVNCLSAIAFTNHSDALAASGDATRFYVANSRFQLKAQVDRFKAETPRYFTDLFSCVEQSPGALRGWLLEYELHPEFDPVARAPASAGMARMVDENRTDECSTVLDIIAGDGRRDISRRVCLASSVRSALSTTASRVTPQKVGWVLKECQFEFLGKMKIAGSNQSVWTTDLDWLAMNDVDQRNALVNEYLNFEADDEV